MISMVTFGSMVRIEKIILCNDDQLCYLALGFRFVASTDYLRCCYVSLLKLYV